MDCVICAWTPDNLDYRFVYETDYWRVVLAPNQSLLGRCVIHLKRHAGDIADLKEDELIEWLSVVRAIEPALRTAFDATMFNWSCYMNLSFQDETPNPHIHWWLVPRYNHTVQIGDWEFTDSQFGNPYDHSRWLDVPRGIHQQIAELIQNAILT